MTTYIRVTNGAVKVETEADQDLRVTNAQIGVEEKLTQYLRVTDAAIMVEYLDPIYVDLETGIIMVEGQDLSVFSHGTTYCKRPALNIVAGSGQPPPPIYPD